MPPSGVLRTPLCTGNRTVLRGAVYTVHQSTAGAAEVFTQIATYCAALYCDPRRSWRRGYADSNRFVFPRRPLLTFLGTLHIT